MQDIRQTYKRMKVTVENRVFDPYLLDYIDRPIIDEDKLIILISILDQLDLTYPELENICLSTMLIQIALDTHEKISTKADEKGRQLTVLAGDYFSGLYYKLLADAEDLSIIKTLSSGVKEVNEQKMSIYSKEADDIERIVKGLMVIESSLITKLAMHFKVSLWNEVLENALLFKRLLNEKHQFIQKGSSFLFDALKKLFFHMKDRPYKDLTHEEKGRLLTVCDHYLEISKEIIENGLRQMPIFNQLLESRIISLLDQYKPYAKSLAEEG